MSDAVWTPSGLDRRRVVEAGGTVVANLRKGRDTRLIAWAEGAGLLVRIDRKTDWGNPFALPKRHTPEQRAEVVRRYREHILGRPGLLARLPELRGRVLACWCHPLPCHGAVLVELLDRGT